MPHFIAEYSANLEDSIEFQDLFEMVNHFRWYGDFPFRWDS